MLYGELQDVRIEGADQLLRGFRFEIQNPPKVAVLRLPTSEEMIARTDKQRSIRKSIGRRKSQTDLIPNPKADLELFNKIRVDKDGAEFDEFEARTAILRLTAADVTECARDGQQYRITLHTPFCDTVHVVRIPTAKQLNQYQLTIVASTELPHNQEELKYRTQSAVELYDAVQAEVEGYAAGTPVPAHHKFAVVGELAQAMNDFDPPFVPND